MREATVGPFASFELDPLTFYVVGSDPTGQPLSSLSQRRIPSTWLAAYLVAQAVPSVEKVFERWAAHDIDGSTLSWPYKYRKEIWDACVHKSSHAIAIGAVQMVLPLRVSASLPEDRQFATAEANSERFMATALTDPDSTCPSSESFRLALPPMCQAGQVRSSAPAGPVGLQCTRCCNWNTVMSK